MSCTFASTDTIPSEAHVLIRLLTSDDGALGAAGLDEEVCALRAFDAKLDQVLLERAEHGLELFVGLGPADEVGRDTLRRAGAAAARALRSCQRAALVLEGEGATLPGSIAAPLAARSFVEGASLALDRFEAYRSEPKDPPRLERVDLVARASAELDEAVNAGVQVAQAVALCRALINTPASDCTPEVVAARAQAIAAERGLSVRVYDEDDARRERLGGLLGVGKGSSSPPRLVRLEYAPSGETDVATVALVGKGITFDSGGLSLKPANSMITMKTDMSGAAAVLATLSVCEALAVPVRVVGFLALAENMPSGSAIRPGDVLVARNGKTIEVLNTDAEGRLVLADALSLATEERPDAIVDLATLTGACVVALGKGVAGRMGNDDDLLDALGEAGRQAGELSWHLPLPSAYRSMIDSEIADMNNMGVAGQAGALTAGLLLKEFVGDVPWAHLDIAGPARSEEDKGYQHKGATGFGVRTLLELLQTYEALGRPAAAPSRGEAVPA